VILGYYKQKELTADTISEDGWLKTGDVGALTAEISTMKLIDRKKNIFKLSQGEYVSSEKVEFFYVKSKYITEAFLHGDSVQSFAVCIVVPNRLEI
jgi:long-chain acyl-CoA synthetase